MERIYYCIFETKMWYKLTKHFIVFSPNKCHFFLKMRLHIEHYLTLLPNIPVRFYNINSQKVNYSSKCKYNTGHFIDFFYEKRDPSSKCDCIWSTILTFLPNNPLCFYTQNFQKVHYSQIIPIILGICLNFLPNKVIFSAKCAIISSNILHLYPNNPVYFVRKNSQNDNFSSNFDYNTGHFIDFSPKKNEYFLKMCLHIEHYLDFFAQ